MARAARQRRPGVAPAWRPFQLAFLLLNLRGLAEPDHYDRGIVDLLFFPTGGGKTEAYLGLAAFTLILRRLPDAPTDLRVVCINRACDFAARSGRTLPILSVDEPIYRRLPGFLIATVDKFAALPWTGEVGALFGRVDRYDADGFYGPCQPKVGQPLPGGHLPPPELIIQDELHLISGPLGTIAGLYETALDALCTVPAETPRRPKIVASTATVRRAASQIRALFNRREVDIFPPPGLERRDSFFAETHPPERTHPRLYVGVAAQGRSLKVVMLRTYLALMAAAQKAYEEFEHSACRSGFSLTPSAADEQSQAKARPTSGNSSTAGGSDYGSGFSLTLEAEMNQAKARPTDESALNPADPYMTLLGYFNSLRELGGSRRIVEDEVTTRLQSYGQRHALNEPAGRFADRTIQFEVLELTSRVSTADVAKAKRRLVHRRLLEKNQYLDEDRKKHPVVPVRFVRACPKGHIGDIDWYFFVHEGETSCRRNLWIDEQGTSGDIASLWVRCDCGKRRSLAQAADHKRFKALRYCDGGRPWLGGQSTQEECHELNRLLIRSASHAYFPQVLSVISLPLQQTDPVMAAVTAVWETVAEAETVEEVEFFSRKVLKVREAIQGYDSGRVLSAIRARREAGSVGDAAPTIKDAELEVLTADQDPIGRDHPDSEFYARAVPRVVWHQPGMEAVERVLLIHRLREVVAQVGFTRFEAVAPDTDGELDIGVERAALGAEGGLVKAGERIHHHLRAALDWARLCGNDPVCAQHKPDDPHERRFLHGAACNGCLLIAETSCEQFNDFLDRTLVAPTVDQAAAAFFPDPA